jgi:predicted GNAT superfamily acetyltransferase
MSKTDLNIEIRECATFEELSDCVALQREVFGLPDLEVSPVRHLIVTKNAGGFILGAFSDGALIGFVLSVPAFRGEERILYSHMTAVRKEFQSMGLGAKLKWSQRERALADGISFIKWTFEPVQPRNAFFNLMRLGATVRKYAPNFYGTDYSAYPGASPAGIDSDRLFADWDLNSERVIRAAQGELSEAKAPDARIVIPADWKGLSADCPDQARTEQLRIRKEFQQAFAAGMACTAFERDEREPAYLLFKEKNGNLPTASP